jgi:acylphosphatase
LARRPRGETQAILAESRARFLRYRNPHENEAPLVGMITRHLRIRGRVQGVGFRMYMLDEARRHGVAGWVRNRRDGSVEAVVQGEADAVEAVIAWARQGPPSARVTDVDVNDGDGDYTEFEQRATE